MAAELQVRCGAFPETRVISRNAALSIIRVSDRDAWKFVDVPTVSSIHISTHRVKCRHPTLAEMIACERCVELHVSDNDSTGDQHRVYRVLPWGIL
jgi:hypothetical protein